MRAMCRHRYADDVSELERLRARIQFLETPSSMKKSKRNLLADKLDSLASRFDGFKDEVAIEILSCSAAARLDALKSDITSAIVAQLREEFGKVLPPSGQVRKFTSEAVPEAKNTTDKEKEKIVFEEVEYEAAQYMRRLDRRASSASRKGRKSYGLRVLHEEFSQDSEEDVLEEEQHESGVLEAAEFEAAKYMRKRDVKSLATSSCNEQLNEKDVFEEEKLESDVLEAIEFEAAKYMRKRDVMNLATTSCDAETQAGTSVIPLQSQDELFVEACPAADAAEALRNEGDNLELQTVWNISAPPYLFPGCALVNQCIVFPCDGMCPLGTADTAERSSTEKAKKTESTVLQEKRTVAVEKRFACGASEEKNTADKERSLCDVVKPLSAKRFRIELKACIRERIASRLPWPAGIFGGRLDDIVTGTTILFDKDSVAGEHATGVVREILRPGHRYERCVVEVSSASIVPCQVVTVSRDSIRAVNKVCLHLVRRPP